MPPASLMTWESNRAAVQLRRTDTLSGTRNEDRGWGERYLDNASTRSSSEAPRVAPAGAATLAARAVRAAEGDASDRYLGARRQKWSSGVLYCVTSLACGPHRAGPVKERP